MLGRDATKPFTLRLPQDLRQLLEAKAKTTRRTLTSLILEGIEAVVRDEGGQTETGKPQDYKALAQKYAGIGRRGDGLDERGMRQRLRLIRGDD